MSFNTYNLDHHERDLFRCYEIDGVLYIPTYNDVRVFTAPGGRTYHEDTLLSAKPNIRYEMLWVTQARRGKAA
jgi:hypothetical protein